MDRIEITLPWGPTLNTMYLNRKKGKGKGRILTEQARNWKLVATLIIKRSEGFSVGLFPKGTPVHVHYLFNEPDKRRRDADNLFKPINDSLTNSKIIADDRQIRGGSFEFGERVKRGSVTITIKKMA